jgi:sigma-B regulation protein RsbU (phosphoserine phosphatase)
MQILVVDDQGFWRRALGEQLAQSGHGVICVDSGEQAWQVLCAEPDVSLLLTDWVMPGMSGPELCRRVRAMPRPRYLPIIVMTSRTASEDLVEALDAGADAFVRKPIDAGELLAQIRVAERIVALEHRLAGQLAALRAAHERLERDLAQAACVQRSFLPSAPPPVPGLEVAWHYESCAQLGGDLFNVFRLSERHVGVYVLDVSGHGTSAALHSVSLSHALHPLPHQGGILKRRADDGPGWGVCEPKRVARELNRRFPLIERSGHFATFLYGVLDVPTRRFRFVRAGHPGPLHLAKGGARCVDEGGGVPIGVAEEAEYADQEIQLAAGDTLVLLTDGVAETRSPLEEEFGLPRVLHTLELTKGARDAVDELCRELRDFRGDEPARDDVTVVALHTP